ncbi:hypothetical protein [uncultured Tateyamaria sp.]|uniref:hypothetical protein n=1 Tax=uncultured Tateyamaria sp. TaxID=455651 RepID=UPI002630FF5D|nr:hypothetical protein [uncultured Tateyamaria sp.]
MTDKLGWEGASGATYTFTKFGIDVSLKPDQDGVYIFAKTTNRGFDAVYIGQGDLKTRIAAHINTGCVNRKDADTIFCFNEASEAKRLSAESDLLALHTEAYSPTGCNVKEGG